MRITLKRNMDVSDRGPLTVLVKRKGKANFIETIKIGQTISVDDELGYAILGDERYRGLFIQEGGASKSEMKRKAAVSGKSATASGKVANKSLTSKKTKAVEVEDDDLEAHLDSDESDEEVVDDEPVAEEEPTPVKKKKPTPPPKKKSGLKRAVRDYEDTGADA